MRTLSVERLFSLGDWKNIRFSDTIDNLPDDNDELANAVRYYQMVTIDMAYLRYMDMYRKMNGMSDTERVAYLLQEKANTLDEISNLLGKQKKE